MVGLWALCLVFGLLVYILLLTYKTMKHFNYQGSRWSGIRAETNKNMARAGYVIITREPSIWRMRKQGGQMATAIDVKPENLPKQVRAIALSLL